MTTTNQFQAAPRPYLHLTLVNSVQTSKVKHVSENWHALVHRLVRKPVVTTDRESLKWPLFVPFKMLTEEEGALMRETGFGKAYSRRKSNVEYMDVIVLDLDNDPKLNRPTITFDDAIDAFSGMACAMYTSFNHKNQYKGMVDKFRVVLPLLEAVELEQVEARKQALLRLFPAADPASFVPSQPFYVPIVHPDRASLHRSHEGSGDWFDLLALDEAKPEVKQQATAYVQTDEVHGDLPTIKLKGGTSYRADELWSFLKEGYEHRAGCFRIGGPDHKPGCFIYRKDSGLIYYDPTVGKGQFIKVMKQQKLRDLHNPEDDVEVETALWTRKPQAQPKPAVKKPIGEVLEYPDGSVDLLRLNQRFLPDNLHERIPPEGITFIRSPKGTGKTELLKKLTEEASRNCESVLMLGHRVYLLKNLAIRTNLDYYLDLEDGETTQSMTLCVNSLTRIDQETDEPYDTIIIDESEQVLQALVSRLLHRELPTIWNNLIWVFKKAKRIICLDADLCSELTIELIQEIRGPKKHDAIFGIINDYRIGEGQTTKVYANRWHLLADALDAITAGEKAFIACNNRKFATVIDAVIKDVGKKSLLVTAETNEQEECQDFINNPTEVSKRYDVVVSSPTLSTGVSIDGNHFTKVFGFFGINPGTFQDVDQAISRVRNCSDVSVWVQGHSKEPALLTEEEIFERTKSIEKGTVKRIFDKDILLTQGQLKWASIYSRITYVLQRWSVRKDEQFCKLRTDLGFTIETVMEEDEKRDAAMAIYSLFKHVGLDRAQAVFDAVEINDEGALELGRKRQRSHDEQLSLERYRLFEVLRGHEWSVETVRSALKQELLRSLARIRLLHLSPPEALIASDREDRARNQSTFTANRHRVVQQELIDHLCKAAKIDLGALYEKAQADEETEITRETLLAVADAYAGRKKDFNYYFNARIKEPTQEKNIKKVWDATFGDHLSLCIMRKKRGTKAKREYRYFIDASKKEQIHRVMRDHSFY